MEAFYHFILPLNIFDESRFCNLNAEAGGRYAILPAKLRKHLGHIDMVKVGGVHIDGNMELLQRCTLPFMEKLYSLFPYINIQMR